MAVGSTSPWQAAARAAARSGRGGFGAGQDLRHDPGRRRHRPGRACTCTATRANSSPTQRSMPMTSEATGHLDLTVMVAFHDAFRRDLGHLARAASRRPAELDQPARRTAVQAGWELLTTQPHLHTPPRTPTCGRACAATWPTVPTSWPAAGHAGRARPHRPAAGGGRGRACRPRRRPPASGDTVDALAGGLHGHLGHKERDVLALIDRSSPGPVAGVRHDQRRRVGIGGAAQLLPGCWRRPPAADQAVLGGCRRRCGWSTGACGSPPRTATTTGSHPTGMNPCPAGPRTRYPYRG